MIHQGSLIALGWLAAMPCLADNASTLAIRILDEKGNPVHARVRFTDADGRPLPVSAAGAPPVQAHPNFPELGTIVEEKAHLSVPPAATALVVDRGPEYKLAKINLDRGDAQLTVKLERWIDMAARGWWSGDLHVHRSGADLPALMQAADLHFAPAISCFNDAAPLSPWPRTTLGKAAQDRVFSVDNCEDERKWGAALFIGVKHPMRLYERASELPSPLRTWSEARKRGAFIDLEKVIWWQSPVIVALSPPDSIGVAVNHFTEDAVSTRASLAKPRDDTKYSSPEGFARYIGDLYITYLSAGFRIPASAGSANGVSRNPLGYNRSYVYLGRQFDHSTWLGGQKAGRNFVTNGPMLERRFDLQTRLVASGLFLLIIAGTGGVVLYAPAIVLAEMTGFPVAQSILLMGTVTAAYTMFGGVRGVIYTDLLQAGVFMSGWLAAVCFVLKGLPGSLEQAWSIAMQNDKLRLIDPSLDFNTPATLWSGLIAMLFTHVALMAVNQKQVQKYLAASGEQNGRRAILFQGFGLLGVYIAFFALGTMLFVFYRVHAGLLPAGIGPDRVFPYFIMHELPAGLRGFVIAGAFAAAMSTMSATLNSLANVTVVDFWDRIRPGNTVWRAKLATALWGVAAIGAGLLAWRLGSILESIVKINSYFYGCLLGTFLLGALTESATARGARVGLVVSVGVVLACTWAQPGIWIWFGAIGCLVSFGCGYLASTLDFHELRHRSPQRARN